MVIKDPKPHNAALTFKSLEYQLKSTKELQQWHTAEHSRLGRSCTKSILSSFIAQMEFLGIRHFNPSTLTCYEE